MVQSSLLYKPPQQNRSDQTLHRLFQASAKLGKSRSLEDVSISEILTEARVSVGSFYARFVSKQHLLAALYDNYVTAFADSVEEILPALKRQNEFGARLDLVLRMFEDMFHLHVGTVRSLHGFLLRSPEGLVEEQNKTITRMNNRLVDGLSDGICARKRALVVVQILRAVARDDLVFQPYQEPRVNPFTDPEFRRILQDIGISSAEGTRNE